MKQVPAICHLYSVRCRPGRSLRIETRTVAAYDLDTGMSAQPSGSTVRASVGQQVNHLALFQVAEDRPIPLPLSPSPVIDPNYPW